MHEPGGRLVGKLLGDLSFTIAGGTVDLPGDKVVAATAFLAATHEPVPRKELLALLWSNGNLGYLRQLLQRMRRLPGIGPALYVTDTHVQMLVNTDVERFLAAVEAEDYETALDEWPKADGSTGRHSFLRSVEPPTTEYDDWLAATRLQYAQLLEDALLALAAQHERQGQPDLAVDAYRELVQIDHLNEVAHLGIMRAELARGNAAAGLDQFSSLVRVLRTEFGGAVEPLPETQKLAEALRTQRQAQGQEAGVGAPVRPASTLQALHDTIGASFLGRAEELERLQALVGDPNRALLTIVGQGGSGKSMLAARLGQLLQPRFEDNVLYASLEATSGVQGLTSATATALGVRHGDPETLLSRCQEAMTAKPTLLILDNFEHLVEHASEVASLASALTNGSAILVTSRLPLNVHGEHVFLLGGLTVPDPSDPASATEADSVQLFLNTARRVNPRFQVTPDALATIAAVCAAVEGLPLAVILAASWVRFMSLEAIRESVLADPLQLSSDLTDIPQRHRRLDGVVASTLVHLPEPEQQRLKHLSVFQGGFDAKAARMVAGASLHNLIRFMNSSLVSTRGDDRFGMHPVISAWGRSQLADAAKLAEADDAMAAHFVATAEKLYDMVMGGELPAYLPKVTGDIDNYRASLRRLESAGAYDDGVRLCIFLVPWWQSTGNIHEGIGWAQRFLPRASPGYSAGRLHSSVGGLLRSVGYMQEAHEHFSRALQVFEAGGHRMAAAVEYGNLASVARNRSRYDEAAAHYAVGIGMLREMDEPYALSVLLNNYGLLLKDMGDMAAALEVYEECLAIRQARNDERGILDSLVNMADILLSQGRATEAMTIWRELDESQGLQGVDALNIKVNICRAHLHLKEYEEALELATEVAAAAEAADIPRITSFALSHMAYASLALGDPEAAASLYAEAASLHLKAEDLVEVARCVAWLALIAGRNQNWDYFHLARQTAEQIWDEVKVEPTEEWRSEVESLLAQAGPVRALTESAAEDWRSAVAELLAKPAIQPRLTPSGSAPAAPARAT